ncbi:MAG: SpaA isopeptide-forming pilin-related protein [Clostridia bacterium]|nr:SpaA isopeptide-forming pilin-related protein [Clostridia bacterium]
MKKLITKLIVVFAIVACVLNIVTIKTFANIDKKNLYSKGDCGRLLKKGDTVVKTYVVVYNQDGKEYPAYCLDKNKAGVDDSINYDVTLDGVIKNVYIWKAITNGYPYKTPEEMGCNTVGEAFMATKMAVYSVLYNYTINDFSPIGEAGTRTWNALNNILLKVNDGENTQISSNLSIVEESTEWKENTNMPGCISKDFYVKPDGPMNTYNIVKEKVTEGTIITDINDIPRQEFKSNEKFRVTMPINELSDGGNIKIKAFANVETKPIFVGRAPNTNNQDYAITGITYENGSGEKMVYYEKNKTKIKIVKKDETGKKALENAVFQLLDKDKKVVISEIKTNEKGEAILENVLPDTYYIKEIQAPTGYILYNGYIEIKPKFNEELTITIKNTKEEVPNIEITENKLEVKNTIKKLPKTGM